MVYICVLACKGIDRDGCSLSGVSARIHWVERKVTSKTNSKTWRQPEVDDDNEDRGESDRESQEEEEESSSEEEEEEEEEGQEVVRRRHRPTGGALGGADEIWPIRRLYKGLHLTLNLEAASLLPVVLR